MKCSIFSWVFLLSFILIGCEQENSSSFQERISPVARNSGFKMEGYYVWGGSVIKVEDTYHMFASRWPADREFPHDYFTMSEIVHATSSRPEGPYQFQSVVIGERDSSYWDSNMAHNPSIYQVGDQFVLFYNASDFTTMRTETRPLRRIGFATATDINGPWHRQDRPIFDVEANNPAILVGQDGSVKLVFRDAPLRIYLATAPSFEGPYTIVNDNLWPQDKLEDFYLFKKDGKYHLICEDNQGALTGHERWGAHLVSDNGIDDWRKFDPVIVYNHDIHYTDGTVLHCNRRERPQLLIEEGRITYLFNGVFDGTKSWCQPVPLEPAYPVD